MTIEGWVSAAAGATGTFPLFERMSSPTDGKHVSVHQDGSIRVLYSGSPGQMVATQPSVFRKDGQWHHVAFVRRLASGVSGADWQIYYDGSPVLRGSLDTPDGPSGMLLQSGTALWKFDGANWVQVNATALATNNPVAMNTVNTDDVTLLSPTNTPTSTQLQPFSFTGGSWAAAANLGTTIPNLFGLPLVGNGLDKLLITYGLEFVFTRDKIYEVTRNSATSFAAAQVAQFTPLANMPDPRSDHMMAYDKRHQIYVLFGGKDASGIYRNDTWTYNSLTRTWAKHYNEDPQYAAFRQAPRRVAMQPWPTMMSVSTSCCMVARMIRWATCWATRGSSTSVGSRLLRVRAPLQRPVSAPVAPTMVIGRSWFSTAVA